MEQPCPLCGESIEVSEEGVITHAFKDAKHKDYFTMKLIETLKYKEGRARSCLKVIPIENNETDKE